MSETFEIYIDGASRGNPGPSGIGIYIRDNNKEIARRGEFLGKTTNNAAEYQALIRALKIMIEEKGKKTEGIDLRVKSDSDLIINQITGNYRIKSKNLIPLAIMARRLLKKFKSAEFKLINRKDNKIADKLANKSMNLMEDIDELRDTITAL